MFFRSVYGTKRMKNGRAARRNAARPRKKSRSSQVLLGSRHLPRFNVVAGGTLVGRRLVLAVAVKAVFRAAEVVAVVHVDESGVARFLAGLRVLENRFKIHRFGSLCEGVAAVAARADIDRGGFEFALVTGGAGHTPFGVLGHLVGGLRGAEGEREKRSANERTHGVFLTVSSLIRHVRRRRFPRQ